MCFAGCWGRRADVAAVGANNGARDHPCSCEVEHHNNVAFGSEPAAGDLRDSMETTN